MSTWTSWGECSASCYGRSFGACDRRDEMQRNMRNLEGPQRYSPSSGRFPLFRGLITARGKNWNAPWQNHPADLGTSWPGLWAWRRRAGASMGLGIPASWRARLPELWDGLGGPGGTYCNKKNPTRRGFASSSFFFMEAKGPAVFSVSSPWIPGESRGKERKADIHVWGCPGAKIWPWVKIPYLIPVNIPIHTKIGSTMGGEFTYQPKWDPMGFDNHGHIPSACSWMGYLAPDGSPS